MANTQRSLRASRQGFVFLLFLSIGTMSQNSAALEDHFNVRLTLALCPQYQDGGVALDIDYRIGNNSQIYPAQIESQTVDAASSRGTFSVKLPSTLGTAPIHVMAFCRNAQGFSKPSNIVTVSNCNALSVMDTDKDGIPNNLEDLNCDNSFSPGDASNPDNVDTDGDGVRDLVEFYAKTNAADPGSSPRPMVVASAAFDPDGDGDSNAVVWRPKGGTWYVRDFFLPGHHLAFQFGLPGDTPIIYNPQDKTSNVGVIRNMNNTLVWILRGTGFRRNGKNETIFPFGVFGDNIIHGPWENARTTNPAVARLYNGRWYFYIYQSDGSIRSEIWGRTGDLPRVQDYDGDGLFDVAVFRPANNRTYVIRSSDHEGRVYQFGSGTADYTVRGDVTGDGVDDISFWEPANGMFYTMLSDNGFDDTRAAARDPEYFSALQLGLYFVHVPLSWNRHDGRILYTVVDHQTGQRFVKRDNIQSNPPQVMQWGVAGDSQG